MAKSSNEKQRIGAALSATRAELNTLFLLVRQNLDIRRYLLDSRKRHLWNWMTVAAIVGWLLSGLPARKQKIYRIIGFAQVREKAGRRRTSATSLEWRVGNYKATSCRLFNKEDCGKGEVPGREFNRRCYQMGGCLFKRD